MRSRWKGVLPIDNKVVFFEHLVHLVSQEEASCSRSDAYDAHVIWLGVPLLLDLERVLVRPVDLGMFIDGIVDVFSRL